MIKSILGIVLECVLVAAASGANKGVPVNLADGKGQSVGSATIRTSAAPCISGIPKPPPAVNTGNTVLCEVSLANMVVVMPQPLSNEASASLATSVLPRRMPC